MEYDHTQQTLHTEINNTTTSYYDVGEGTLPVIFLHGFPFDKSMWNGQLDGLKESNRVIAYDIRGFGQSTDDNSPWSIDLFARDLVAFMDKLDIEKAIICGLSMGGYIVLNAVSRFPERFTALILCDTQCIADTAKVKAKCEATIEQVNREGVDEFNENFVKSVFHPNTLSNKPVVVSDLKAIVAATAKRTITAGLTALAERSETCSVLAAIRIPTLILCGKEDEVTPLAQSEFMHKHIDGSMLQVIADAGHVSNLEQPIDFNKYVQDFLDILNSAIVVEIPFEVNLGGVVLTIKPLDTVDFLIYEGHKRVAIITPVRDGETLNWSSRDISAEYAQQIGELVAAHENF